MYENEWVQLAKPKSCQLQCCGMGQPQMSEGSLAPLDWGASSVFFFPPLPDLSVQQGAALSVGCGETEALPK